MPQRVLALEIAPHEFKAAYLDAGFRDYQILGFHRAAIQGDGSSRADQLKRFLATHGMLGATTVLSSLGGDTVTWRSFFLPFRDRRKLDQTVPFELETQVPFGLDEVVVDYQVTSRTKEGSHVLAALVRRDDLETHLNLLSDAGLDPKVVDVAPLAMLNVLRMTDKDLPDSFVYVGVDDDRVSVGIYREGALVGLRTIVSLPPVEVAAEQNGHAAVAADPLDSLIGEIRWSILALSEGPIDRSSPCVVAGAGPVADGLRSRLPELLGLRARPVGTIEAAQIPAELRGQIGQFLTPFGLAMREVTPNETIGVNFRRGEYTYHRAGEELRTALQRTMMLAALVIALLLGHTYTEHQRLSARAAVLDSAVRQIFKETLEGVAPSGDLSGQIQAEIDTLQKKLDVLAQVVPVDGATAIDAARAIAVALPPTVKIEVDEFTMDTGQIRMKSNSESFETVDAIKQKIASGKYFGAVEVKNVKQSQDGASVDFLLMLDLSKTPPMVAPE